MAATILTRAFQLLLIVGLFCSTTHSEIVRTHRRRHAVTNLRHVHSHIRRQGSNTGIYPVLGVLGLGLNNTAPRLEIRELQRNQDLFNLYLLGLQHWQETNQDDKFSYFQVAGIHGRPFIPWDDVPGRPQPSQGYKEGYCHHSSNLFPTWHRPFLALVEERIYFHAREVVAGFPEGGLKSRMVAALPALRLPFWDAAAVPPIGTGSYPWSVQRSTIEVELPDGTGSIKKTIPNPLYSYSFHPLPAKDLFGKLPWTHWQTTVRYPTDRYANAHSQDSKIASELDLNLVNLRQRTYQMFAMQRDYHNISNNMVTNGGVLDSLESVHDTIHNTVGSSGPGHMTNAAYSAFDPVFWLLHTNIDRMTAIWQALNPDSWVTNHSNPMATFTSDAGAYADEDTPLHPFHRNHAGDFWTSASVRDHTIFGYTYPELLGLSDHDTLVRRINQLYGEGATSQFSWKLGDPIPRPASGVGYTLNERGSISMSSPQTGKYHYQYFANIKVQKSGSEGGYKIFVFVGPTSAATTGSTYDATVWMRDPSFVGFTGFQTTNSHGDGYTGDPNAVGDANGVVAMTIALENLLRTGELTSFDEEAVGEYLHENMSWRITTADHRIIAPEDTPGFQIDVSYAKIKPPTPDSFPEMQGGGYKQLLRATSGKSGGAQGD
ncbi:common central domain of tyrosinase-domain-containing protein [Boeremia exigua]|uniref:common central domain of tyrosinase-domain-containing protein n=1 Tax=Boeremia exigua TaxID=749465 RepID=UPI001E8D5238|nr:common central domain of tyrosinase-domain-containing protein [Boeremia exigua]KAH6644006.1 common central domain of tyrosinase-domain-containing protein [Boeremia exigua]